MVSGSDPAEEEAIRHKNLAESNFRKSNLESALNHARTALRLSPSTEGLSSMVTAFEIISSAADSVAGDSPEWYRILQVEPFSHTNTIKQRYRKLALVLHPDKNPYVGCEEAFKLVNEGFRVFSDRIRRKEYDMKLRIRIQEESASAVDTGGGETSTFRTACSGCLSLHKFDKKYLGHNLMCPKCKKSFEAKEIEKEEEGKDGCDNGACSRNKIITYRRRKTIGIKEMSEQKAEAPIQLEGLDEESGEGDDEGMTLAQMHSIIKRNRANKLKSKIDEKYNREENMERDTQEKSLEILMEMSANKENGKGETSKNGKNMTDLTEVVDLEAETSVNRKRRRNTFSQESEMDESDLYDFAKDRTVRSFKKGQVWAMYTRGGEDRMPRSYCLIGEVFSLNPFKVQISWLKLENEKLISWAKTGYDNPCGMFRVSEKTLVKQLKPFSHVVDCERAAREVYVIYPRKGSVWAVHTKNDPVSRGRNDRGYDIALCLTMYSDTYGLSLAYLEKVEGYMSLFKRREFGSEAIRWLGKDDVSVMLSHQIPARKLPEDQSPDGVKECWVIDPASLPPDLITDTT
ncbi:PREDICTED: uncharacterized protein LOC104814411 [Tarenaya hassleriana]|uniref:uncharacterized protein LOC104814411 n=1 Tax=Tarenaya hassleriana TaxID=28532 RepID=UPI00053C140C|nr:PREDICTED: uncharacterized protein LOC104814411 [Tarenaya hassleriana]